MNVFEYMFHPDNGEEMIVLSSILLVVVWLLRWFLFDLPEAMRIRSVKQGIKQAVSYTPARVVKIVNKFSDNDSYEDTYNFAGMYVMYNKSKKKCFVGVSEHVMESVIWHIIGEGDDDVHEDLEAGDEWDIRFLRIEDTICRNMNALLWAGIDGYKSNRKRRGYN